MKSEEISATSSYSSDGPWMFKGRAFYQIHLVKADLARKCIPKGLKLVQAFGYTLGGMYLAQYDDSPVGKFDELVVIGGTLWNWPTSCAWAARVLVNNKEARNHGRREIGLPSRFASFSKDINIADEEEQQQSISSKLLSIQKLQFGNLDKVKITINDSNGLEIKASMEPNVDHRWMGPSIRFRLPSFSGCTEFQPHLLKYSCSIDCRMQFVKPTKVSASYPKLNGDDHRISDFGYGPELEKSLNEGITENEAQDLIVSVLSSRPILALAFNEMEMTVRPPTVALRKIQE